LRSNVREGYRRQGGSCARGADGHLSISAATFVTGLADSIPVPEAGIELPMERLYEGLSLPPDGP